MAAMAMSMPYHMREFEVVEQKVTRVDAGLTFSQKMNIVVQTCFSLIHLTGAFHAAAQEQAELIGMLLQPEAQDLDPEQYGALAAKIEGLVASNERVITGALSIEFRPWAGYLAQMKDQSEHLAGIAESFRMACDDESLTILAEAAMEIESGYLDQSRKLVGTMHA
jgi:hypothetical protein